MSIRMEGSVASSPTLLVADLPRFMKSVSISIVNSAPVSGAANV